MTTRRVYTYPTLVNNNYLSRPAGRSTCYECNELLECRMYDFRCHKCNKDTRKYNLCDTCATHRYWVACPDDNKFWDPSVPMMIRSHMINKKK